MDYSRQLELFDNRLFNEQVHVIGAGATGSWVVMMLAKLGVKNVHIWDFDKVEQHNIPNQCFGESDINSAKAISCVGIARTYGNMLYTCHNKVVTADTQLQGIVFMLTDTMSSRKEIFDGAIKYKPSVKLLIETRMGLSSGRVYCINPMDMGDVARYENTLYADDEAEVSACGASKSVVTSAMAIASQAVRCMLNWNNNIVLPNESIVDFLTFNIYNCVWSD